MPLGENLRNLRKEHGLIQGELSERSGIKLAHISKLERDESAPKLSTIEKLTSALGCSADQLIHGEQGDSLDAWIKSAIEGAALLPTADKAALLGIIKKYVVADKLNTIMEEVNPTPEKLKKDRQRWRIIQQEEILNNMRIEAGDYDFMLEDKQSKTVESS